MTLYGRRAKRQGEQLAAAAADRAATTAGPDAAGPDVPESRRELADAQLG